MVEKADVLPDRANVITEDGPDQDLSKLNAIRDRFQIMYSFWGNIHSEALDDDKFMAGKQWDDQRKKEREEAGRPCLTYNLFPSFCRQILNKVRQERPQVRVVPVETDRYQTPDIENVQGTKDYSMSDVYMGILRNIEHRSRADHAYDTSLQHAVHHGFGYFLLTNREVPTNPFVQELIIKRVKNSYAVLLDPMAQEADYSDAQDGFIFSDIARTTFEKKYPDVPESTFDSGSMLGNYDGWYDPNNLRIAEYRWIDYKDDEVLMLSNGKVVFYSEVKDVLDDMERDSGVHVEQHNGLDLRKAVRRPVCMWQKMTADNILDGPTELPFQNIPIFPVLGDEILVEGQMQYESAIRHAKDAQRSYNYWRTSAAESVALAPRAPLMATEKQIAPYQNLYDTMNTENHAVLLYKHVAGIPPPKRLEGPDIAVAELANATQDANDMQTIIGLHEANLGAESNEKSGKAILARQAQGSNATYQFPDNLNRALEAMGRCAVYAIPRIYDTQRTMRIRMPDDTEDFVEINKTVKDSETGKETLVHDINYGGYDVVIETGPAYATQRQEALDAQLKLLDLLPDEIAGNVVHLIVKNMGIPGSEEIGRILRKMLPDELKSEDERLADLPKGVTFDDDGNMVKDGEPWQPEPSPKEQLAQRQQELEEAKIDAEMAKSEADKAEAEAKTKMAEAKLAEAELKMAEVQAGGEGGDDQLNYAGMMPEIEKIVQETMQSHEIEAGAHKDTIEEQLSDAVGEILERVKKYVDKAMKEGAAAANDELDATPGDGEIENTVVEMPAGKRLRMENIKRTDGQISGADVVILDDARSKEVNSA